MTEETAPTQTGVLMVCYIHCIECGGPIDDYTIEEDQYTCKKCREKALAAYQRWEARRGRRRGRLTNAERKAKEETKPMDLSDLSKLPGTTQEEVKALSDGIMALAYDEPLDLPDFPIIVCLCGSTKFCDPKYADAGGMNPWERANYDETLAGRIVLTVGVDMRSDAALGLSDEVKGDLDDLHMRKIELCDQVLVLNVGGYIGASTAKEIAYGAALGKEIRYLEPIA